MCIEFVVFGVIGYLLISMFLIWLEVFELWGFMLNKINNFLLVDIDNEFSWVFVEYYFVKVESFIFVVVGVNSW